jgi:ArsR family transcriptional regulator
MKDLELEKFTSLFKALSDENRMAMIYQLCQCPPKPKSKSSCMNVGELSSCCDIDLSVVSRHLSKLKSAGVLRAHKEGKQVFYTLEKSEIAKKLRALADLIENSGCC